jgi:hypothetical protein
VPLTAAARRASAEIPGIVTIAAAAAALLLLVAVPASAAPFEVNRLDDGADEDTADGICEATDGVGDCTLRAALQQAAGGVADSITFSVSGTHTVGSTLTALGPLTITGHPSGTTVSGGNLVRVFAVGTGDPSATTTMQDLTVTQGALTANDNGAGILHNQGVLVVNRVNVTGNHLTGAGTAGGAGVVGAVGTTLQINDSTIANNTIPTGNASGGGILAAALHLRRSTVTGNSAGQGGGIKLDGTSTIENSTISGNSLNGAGGGGDGSGIRVDAGTLSVTHSTIADNTGGATGAGISPNGTATVPLKSTVLADNGGGNCRTAAITSSGGNIEDGTTCGFATTGTDKPSTEPLLAALANNGGPTQTRALMAGSPAIDAAPDCSSLTVDQRGFGRPGGAACDSGAFEVQPPSTGSGGSTTGGPGPGPGPGPTIPAGPATRAPSNLFSFGKFDPLTGVLIVNVPGPGTVGAEDAATAKKTEAAARQRKRKKRKKAALIKTIKTTATKAGPVRLKLALSRAGKARLRRRGKLGVTVRVTYTPTGGTPRSVNKRVTFKAKRKKKKKRR